MRLTQFSRVSKKGVTFYSTIESGGNLVMFEKKRLASLCILLSVQKFLSGDARLRANGSQGRSLDLAMVREGQRCF